MGAAASAKPGSPESATSSGVAPRSAGASASGVAWTAPQESSSAPGGGSPRRPRRRRRCARRGSGGGARRRLRCPLQPRPRARRPEERLQAPAGGRSSSDGAVSSGAARSSSAPAGVRVAPGSGSASSVGWEVGSAAAERRPAASGGERRGLGARRGLARSGGRARGPRVGPRVGVEASVLGGRLEQRAGWWARQRRAGSRLRQASSSTRRRPGSAGPGPSGARRPPRARAGSVGSAAVGGSRLRQAVVRSVAARGRRSIGDAGRSSVGGWCVARPAPDVGRWTSPARERARAPSGGVTGLSRRGREKTGTGVGPAGRERPRSRWPPRRCVGRSAAGPEGGATAPG